MHASLLLARKQAPPPPSLNDATGRIDASVARLDEKIAKLEGELRRYKEQMKVRNSIFAFFVAE